MRNDFEQVEFHDKWQMTNGSVILNFMKGAPRWHAAILKGPFNDKISSTCTYVVRRKSFTARRDLSVFAFQGLFERGSFFRIHMPKYFETLSLRRAVLISSAF